MSLAFFQGMGRRGVQKNEVPQVVTDMQKKGGGDDISCFGFRKKNREGLAKINKRIAELSISYREKSARKEKGGQRSKRAGDRGSIL